MGGESMVSRVSVRPPLKFSYPSKLFLWSNRAKGEIISGNLFKTKGIPNDKRRSSKTFHNTGHRQIKNVVPLDNRRNNPSYEWTHLDSCTGRTTPRTFIWPHRESFRN